MYRLNTFVVSGTAAVIGALGTAATAGIGFATANAAGIGALTGVYGQVKSQEAAAEQQKALNAQNQAQAGAIARERQIALGRRKELINRQRKQIVGSSNYSISKTGSVGAAPVGATLLG